MSAENTMIDSDFQCVPGHEGAIEWALGRVPASRLETVVENNWACTYRLSEPAGDRYLKVVPAGRRAAVAGVVAVAERFRDEVPEVIAADAERGWLLFADHGGHTPTTDDEMPAVLARFGAMQARAATSPGLLACLERLDPMAAIDALLAFLDRPGEDETAPVGAAYFVGETEARRYRALFAARAPLLRAQAARGRTLPPTISHGDLHRGNVAIRDDGSVRFFDWDEVASGPAGLCLHGVLQGCAHATIVLKRLAEGREPPASAVAERVAAYVDALAGGGYATREALLEGLPGPLCAGLASFVASYGRYPGETRRASSAAILRTKLSDLLDLCDWLACADPATADACADDYERRAEWHRAFRIVQDRLSRAPEDVGLIGRYGALAWRLGDAALAEEAFTEALAKDPADTRLHAGLARCALARLDFDAARTRLADVDAGAADGAVAEAARRLDAMRAAIAQADVEGALPRWTVSAAEQASGRLEPDSEALVAELFRRYGVVQLDEVFAASTIATMQSAFAERYGSELHDGEHPDALEVGDRRWMLTMTLDDVFGAPELIASGLILPVMRRVLGKECILSAYTAVVSLPGSEDQTTHKDHSELFEEHGWLLEHPAFAAQAIVPLLELDETTGATRVFKASQRVPLRKCDALPHQDPVVPLGSIVLLDYSVAHHGLGNRSDRVRPILNLVYSRPWFRDCRNYHLQPPLRFTREFFEQAPPEVRGLVGWWDLERRAAQAEWYE
ncbi:MAG: tetratricopeptide repeat protein [Burkholderiales bacterium]|jgi:ectoine hydroxylase-related dioxygenase (phytanoyl-CoA dioxygenase family)